MPDGARIGCVGELLVEFMAGGLNGHHRLAGNYVGPFPSGAPGIFIDQAARAGATCIFVGAVGDDAFGAVITERLAGDGVDMRLVNTVAGIPTGSAFVSYNSDGSRDFVFNIAHSAAARFEADAATLAALAAFKLDVMHVSGSALGDAAMAAKILTICESLHAQGVRISFDPNIRRELLGSPGYDKVVRELMARCAIFLPSDADAEILFPGEALESFAPKLFAQGAECVVLKRGDKGAMGITRAGQTAIVKAHRVEAVDPTGAGDCFCATFVALYCTGRHDLRSALQWANAAGALAVTKVGPMEGAGTLAEIEAFLAASA